MASNHAATVERILSAARSWHASESEADRNQAAAAINSAEALIEKHGLDRAKFQFPGAKPARPKGETATEQGEPERREQAWRNPYRDQAFDEAVRRATEGFRNRDFRGFSGADFGTRSYGESQYFYRDDGPKTSTNRTYSGHDV